jgi:hypothetical protein
MSDILEEILNDEKDAKRLKLFRKLFPAIITLTIIIALGIAGYNWFLQAKATHNQEIGDSFVQLISDESLTQRKLENIQWNEKQQIDLLSNFTFTEELSLFPFEKTKEDGEFFYKNGNYEFGDADIWYSLIRYFKPRRIVEVGSGYSTLIAVAALKKNKNEDMQLAFGRKNLKLSCRKLPSRL